MKINFEFEDGNYYAIADEAEYNGQICESLWYSEINSDNTVRWDDDYRNPISFSTLELAKEYILREYFKHTPQIIGYRFDV